MLSGRRGWRLWHKRKNQKRRTDYELYKKRNSLIISPLFFDAFTGELISLITRINYKCSPPSSLTGLFDFFFFTLSSHQVKHAVLYLYHEKLLIIPCQHSWRWVRFGRPPTDMSVGGSTGREKQANWLSLEYVTELRAWWTDSSLFIREVTWCSGWTSL